MLFEQFKPFIAKKFKTLSSHKLFTTSVAKDDLWKTYIESFPPEINPVYKNRTSHDCSACRGFVKNAGNIVASVDGKLTSIWDVQVGDSNYQKVADALNLLVTSAPISNVFLYSENKIGVEKTFEKILDKINSWEHFCINLPPTSVADKKDIPTKLGEYKALHDVLLRSCEELTPEAVDTVLELIAQNSLYRGEEHKHAINKFKEIQRKYNSSPNNDLYIWESILSLPISVSKIRNTAIGTLLIDISEGKDIEDAVGAFERMVAPTNYRRPTSLVTQKMVDAAKKTVETLGLTSALERRYATSNDLNINDILYADKNLKRELLPQEDIFGGIATGGAKKFNKLEEIGIDKFLSDILPTTTSLEVMVENRHTNNFVSLIAPVDPTARKLFTWDNNFSWSYAGEVTDSIKEKVKAAGGNVTGEFCCRLAWYNYDDLDLHMQEPGHRIYYAAKFAPFTGGMLDVDMNAGSGTTRTPVENIFYPKISEMIPGVYTLSVNQFCQRETSNPGFDIEVDILGTTYSFNFPMAVRGEIKVADFEYSKAGGLKLLTSLPKSRTSKEIWGVTTNDFTKVKTLMLSPNFWGDQPKGNKHYMFILEGCKNPDSSRGIYNEFLAPELLPHRKVFELLGAKIKAPYQENQLSGLGFSSTQRNELVVRVTGKLTRLLKIKF
jgi:hypothetical protein